MELNSVADRTRRLALVAFVVAGGTILTQALVSASASAVERSDQTDSILVALTHTVNTVQGSLGPLVGARDAAELRGAVRDFDAVFDRILARFDGGLASTPPGELDLGAIDVEQRALIHAVDTASTPESSPYLASGWRAIDLQAQKLTGAILRQRELLEIARSRTILQAETMVALSSGGVLLLMAYFVWRPVIAMRAALNHRRLIAPLFG